MQVIVLDLADVPEAAFLAAMSEVGEAIARDLQQREVIMEIQKRGVVQRVYTVTP